MRRSRSPWGKRTTSEGPSRRHSPVRYKIPPNRSTYKDERRPHARSRSPRNRSRTPPRHSPGARHRSLSGSRDILDRRRGSGEFTFQYDGRRRMRSEERNILVRASYRGSERIQHVEDLNYQKNRKKKNHGRDERDNLRRDLINLEKINVVRRAGEGSHPIFERDEIINHGRKVRDGDVERRRAASRSPEHSIRRRYSSERYKHRESFYEERGENYRRPASRDRDSRSYDRSRGERERYSPSARDYSDERSDRDNHRSFRRSPGRSSSRLPRRSPSRTVSSYREKTPEVEEPLEPEIRDDFSPSRGRGRGIHGRGRYVSGFPGPRVIPGAEIIHPIPLTRSVRAPFLPRPRGAPIIINHPRFPPSVAITPVLFGRPHIIPVRHSVLRFPH